MQIFLFFKILPCCALLFLILPTQSLWIVFLDFWRSYLDVPSTLHQKINSCFELLVFLAICQGICVVGFLFWFSLNHDEIHFCETWPWCVNINKKLTKLSFCIGDTKAHWKLWNKTLEHNTSQASRWDQRILIAVKKKFYTWFSKFISS